MDDFAPNGFIRRHQFPFVISGGTSANLAGGQVKIDDTRAVSLSVGSRET